MKIVAAFTVMRWDKAERLDELLAVVHSAFREFDPPSGVLNETLEHLTARFRSEIFLVALAGGDIIGSIFCARKDGALYLTRMAVLPAWRQRGVGHALMAAAEAEARRIGAMKLTLRVRKNLPSNHVYFERFGFAVTGEGADPGRPPYDTMELPLSQKHVVG